MSDHNNAIEAAAQVCDKRRESEMGIYVKAGSDSALSETGRYAIMDRAISRATEAKEIGATIRALKRPDAPAAEAALRSALGPDAAKIANIIQSVYRQCENEELAHKKAPLGFTEWPSKCAKAIQALSASPAPPAEAALRSALETIIERDQIGGYIPPGEIVRHELATGTYDGEFAKIARQALSASPAPQPSAEEVEAFAVELRNWWSFDDRQFHTHSWHSREDFIKTKLPALLAALTRSPSVERVADGWKLVPIEPTNEMIKAAAETPGMKAVDKAIIFAAVHGGGLPKECEYPNTPLHQAWNAMLSASPPEGK